MTNKLDIQQSIIAVNGNTALAKELFTMLLTDLDVRLQQIEDSQKEDNMSVLAEHIHKLYGATAYCIVPNLRKAAADLDERLRQKDYSKISLLVNTVLQEGKKLINDGPDYLEKNWSDYN